MNLGDLEIGSQIKLLVVGASGAGKTIFSCSGPGRTFVFDFDNKVSSAATFYRHHAPEKLKQIDYEAYPLNKDQNPYLRFRAQLDTLEKKRDAFPYQTVAVDSLTLYSEALMAHIRKTNPGIKRAWANVPAMQDYLVAGVEFREDINRLLSLPCHVICTAHPTVKEDPQTGEIKNSILLSGKIADHLPRIFHEVYWASVRRAPALEPGKEPKIEHVAQTRSDGRYTCRTQIPTIPSVVPLDFGVIQKYMATVGKPAPAKEMAHAQ